MVRFDALMTYIAKKTAVININNVYWMEMSIYDGLTGGLIIAHHHSIDAFPYLHIICRCRSFPDLMLKKELAICSRLVLYILEK